MDDRESAERMRLLAEIERMSATNAMMKAANSREIQALVEQVGLLQAENTRLRVACKAWLVAVENEMPANPYWTGALWLTRHTLGEK